MQNRPLKVWYRIVNASNGKPPSDVKDQFRSASIISRNRIVFNIAGNKYRVVVSVNYPYGVVCIRFVGTHQA